MSQEVDVVSAEKQRVVDHLEQLNAQANSITPALSRAIAKSELARAFLHLDRDRAGQILIEAIKMTFPESNERVSQGQEIAKGQFAPNRIDLRRRTVRDQIFRIASFDRELSKILRELVFAEIKNDEASLAGFREAISDANRGDIPKAAEAIGAAVQNGEFNMNLGQAIFAIAARDRVEADRLIVQVLDRLRVSRMDPNSFASTIIGMDMAVYGEVPGFFSQTPVQSSSREVIVSYLSFQLDKIVEISQFLPNGAREMRGHIVSLWPRITQLAPELAPRFHVLEALSRVSPNDTNLPDAFAPEKQDEIDEDLYKRARKTRLDTDIEVAIRVAQLRKKWDLARELASLFRTKDRANQFLDVINANEAKHLIAVGDIQRARRIAVSISDIRLAIGVYRLLLRKATPDNRSEVGLNREFLQELLQRLTTTEQRTGDIAALGQFAITSAGLDREFAIDVLIEMTRRFNKVEAEALGPGDVLFSNGSFVSVLSKSSTVDEFDKVVAIALLLKDPLHRIIALASIANLDAERISERIRSSSPSTN